MKIFRRKLLQKIALLTVTAPIISKLRVTNIPSSKLKNNLVSDINEASSLRTYVLPNSPKEGETVYFHIPQKSLRFPSRIKYKHHKIAGEKDDLILDSLANICLKFKNENEGWILS